MKSKRALEIYFILSDLQRNIRLHPRHRKTRFSRNINSMHNDHRLMKLSYMLHYVHAVLSKGQRYSNGFYHNCFIHIGNIHKCNPPQPSRKNVTKCFFSLTNREESASLSMENNFQKTQYRKCNNSRSTFFLKFVHHELSFLCRNTEVFVRILILF